MPRYSVLVTFLGFTEPVEFVADDGQPFREYEDAYQFGMEMYKAGHRVQLRTTLGEEADAPRA